MNEKEIEQAVLASKITLTLTVGEVNMVLGLIGKYPFEEVNGLVKRIHDEGQPQIQAFVEGLKAAEVTAETVVDVVPQVVA